MPFLGSRGDVQPGISLALELERRGHQVTLGVPPNLLDLAARAGVGAVSMGPDSQRLLESDLVRIRTKSPNPIVRARALAQLGTYGWRQLAGDLNARAGDATVVVSSFLGQEVARAIADKHDLAQVAVHFFPLRPARSVSLLPDLRVGGAVANRVAWHGVNAVWRAMTRSGEDRMRADLGLPRSDAPLAARMTAAAGLEVQAVDPLLFPDLAAEWGVRRPLVGFVDVAPETLSGMSGPSGSDSGLEAWLAAGPPPVYWGFGSMPVRDPRATLDVVRAVSADLGVRSLVCAGWSEFAASEDEQVRVFRTVNHRAVFPRCAVAVHHGGAGTTAAALRAGTPSLVAWFGADQQLWGSKLAALGVGSVMRFGDLDRESAAAALTRLMAEPVRTRAAEVQRQLIDPVTATRTLADLVEQAEARQNWRVGRAAHISVPELPAERPNLVALAAVAPVPVGRAEVGAISSPRRSASISWAVQTEALTCRFGDRAVVDAIDIEIEPGRVFGLLGPNGAGKTTLVRMLATLQPPASGTGRVFGHDIVRDQHRVRSMIALTGQYAAVDEDLTARENLVIFSRLLGLARPAARSRAQELLDSFSLSDAADRSLRQFSGGMRRRLDLAVSMIGRPPLLFLDEPTTGLDPRTRMHLWESVRALVNDGTTVLLTTQYLEEADQLADRIAVINHGKIVADGTAAELKRSIGNATLRLSVTDPAHLGRSRQVAEGLVGREATELDEHTLIVPLVETSVVADVLIALRSAGVEIAEVSVQTPTLDEVFFEVTSRPVDGNETAEAVA